MQTQTNPSRISMSARRGASRLAQKGFTLIELIIGGIITLIVGTGLAYLLLGQLDDSRGRTEGQTIASAALCGAGLARSMGTLGSATLPALLNNNCFGRNDRITGRGTAGASLNNTILNTAYAVGNCTITSADDGLGVDTQTGPAECTAIVDSAAKNGAVQILVTPNGGGAATVKVSGGAVNRAAAGLTTACNGTAPITVRACARF